LTVAALIMAAGLSRRAAPHNKLLLRDEAGITMVARVADSVLASRARPVLAVIGHQAAAVRAALAGRDLRFVEAEDYLAGMAASLRAGVAALPMEASGVLVCLGDMPLVSAELLDRLIAVFEAESGAAILVPAFLGRRGNPVLLHRRFFSEIMACDGDHGARSLVARHAQHVRVVETGVQGVVMDFDEGGPGWST
jgi:molybdenum cofactor cytidylyltransferase